MRSFKSNRGSVLIVALMFAAIIAISLTSYLKLSLNAGSMANRSFYLNAAQNLLDAGFERTIWTLNDAKVHTGGTNWTTYGGFTEITLSSEYRGTFPSSSTHYTLSGGAKGQVKVWALYNTGTKVWHTVAKATITLGDGTTLDKTAECYLQQRSWSDGGMVSRQGMSFNGNVRIDSWKSRPSLTLDVPYTTAIALANAQVSCPSLITVQNADICGYVAIGTDTLTGGLTVGSTGRVVGWSGEAATATSPSYSTVMSATFNNYVDPARVTFDFNCSFPDVDLPTNTGSAILPITSSRTFNSNAVHTVPSMTYTGSADELLITSNADVTLIFTGDVSMSGTSKIIIDPGSKLTIYAAGDFSMGGNSGIRNGTTTVASNPDRFTLLGTRTSAAIAGGALMQNWDLRGLGSLSCVVYAPNADVSIDGTADIYGSVVGNRVDMVGSGNFHQDESLKDNRVTGLWGLMKWRELATTAERATYATQLNF